MTLKNKTPMKRSAPMKRTPMQKPLPGFKPVAAKPPKGPKKKTCKNRECRARYVPNPDDPRITWCSDDCGVAVALAAGEARKAKLEAAKRAAKRAERKEDKIKLDKAKSIGDLKAEAQIPFNQWVRLRDELAGEACICCGKMPTAAEALRGGAWDAAHYRSRGSADHLRFDERNVHRALKYCNKYGHTDYRGGLIDRIGIEAVEALDSDQTIVKWTVDYLLWVKAEYSARLAALQKGIRREHQTYSPDKA